MKLGGWKIEVQVAKLRGDEFRTVEKLGAFSYLFRTTDSCSFKVLNSKVISFIHGILIFQVIDFGSSCYEHQRVYTYIQSRFYRAPEVILGARYGMPIDMWSLGCILAELLTGYPLLPGEDEGDQLSCIIELLGMPPQKLLDQSKRAKNFISSKGKQNHHE